MTPAPQTAPGDLSARVLAPRRPRLAEAQAVAAAYATRTLRWPAVTYSLPRVPELSEVWEALAARGVIPAGWVQDPGRVFDCTPCNGTGEDPVSLEPWRCPHCARVCPMCKGIRTVTLVDAVNADGTVVNPRNGPCLVCSGFGTYSDGKSPHPPTVAACCALASDPDGIATAEALVRERYPAPVVWRVADRERLRAECSDENVIQRQHCWLGEALGDALLATGYALWDVAPVTLVCPALGGER